VRGAWSTGARKKRGQQVLKRGQPVRVNVVNRCEKRGQPVRVNVVNRCEKRGQPVRVNVVNRC
jgi:hypothetical protein